jgi:hypothetical protein
MGCCHHCHMKVKSPMNAYEKSRGIAPLILNIDTRWRSVVNITPLPLYPWERTPVPTESEAGWATEPVCTHWRGRKLLPLPNGCCT